jgi:hypothetical protein
VGGVVAGGEETISHIKRSLAVQFKECSQTLTLGFELAPNRHTLVLDKRFATLWFAVKLMHQRIIVVLLNL